jgi:hypothetical protein
MRDIYDVSSSLVNDVTLIHFFASKYADKSQFHYTLLF